MTDHQRRAGIAALVGVAALAVAGLANRDAPVIAQGAPEPVEIVSRYPESNDLVDFEGGRSPTMSADGSVVVFEPGLPFLPGIRRRLDGETRLANPSGGENVRVSDDGCVIAYTGPQIAVGNTWRSADVYNHCTGESWMFGTVYSGVLERPGVSADGSVIAVSYVTDQFTADTETNGIAIYELGPSPQSGALTTYNLVEVHYPPDPDWPVAEIDLSDDGQVFAYRSGPSLFGTLIDFDQSNIWVVDRADPGPVAVSVAAGQPTGRADDPSVSGDGTLVAFHSSNALQVYDRTSGAVRSVVPQAFDSRISRDGRYLTYELLGIDNSDNLDVYVSYSADRWATSTPPDFVSVPLPGTTPPFRSARQPAISAHGRWVAWDTQLPEIYSDDPGIPGIDSGGVRNWQVLVRERPPVLAVESLEFGSRSVPGTLNAIVENVGPSGWQVTSLGADPPFEAVANDCPSLLQQGDSCLVTVRYDPPGIGAFAGQLTVRDDSYPGVPHIAVGGLTASTDGGGSGVVTTTTTTTTTEPPVGPTTTTTTTTTLPPGVGLSIAPDPVVFGDQVVGASSVARTATVTNAGEIDVAIQTVAVVNPVGATDFAVVDDECSDEVLAPGETCELAVTFVAGEAGGRVGTLSVSGTSGTFDSARLQGSGRFDAELTVTPEVASGGQVVAVVGAGFPADTTVEVVVGDDPPRPAATDATGRLSFLHVVLSGSPQGEVTIDDVAVGGEYDAGATTFLVVGTPVRPQALPNSSRLERNHVSR